MSETDVKKIEEKMLRFWDDRDVFKRSLAQRQGKKPFVFFEGPPTANGRPGIHHFIGRVFKDLIPRYKTMRGYYVLRKAGWDTHGLPVEIEVEKQLGIKNKKEIEEYGIAKFNEKARESVWKYKDEWQAFTKRIGFWIDLGDPYITYEPRYIESLWWVIQQIDKKKLLYEGHKVLPWCFRCGTALSSHELAQGYQDVKDISVYAKFKVTNEGYKNTYILAWTTTPWTLPGNLALAVSPKAKYVKVKTTSEEGKEEFYILAEERLSVMGDQKYEKVEDVDIKELLKIEYEPLFDIKPLRSDKSYRVYPADFVTTTDGTGIVHTAVMYGEDDYNLGKELGLPMHHTVDVTGRFTEDVKGLSGKIAKNLETEIEILKYLQKSGKFFKKEKYEHSYPHCWRCKTPLIYYAKNSWFVAMSKLRKQLVKNNSKVNWYPSHLKEGRFGEFLKEAKDWAFSRERYWGTPLPIWKCEKCNAKRVLGSFAELPKEPLNEKGEFDPHRPYIDEITLKCEECEGTMRRVKEVSDVWFDSGAMPYAQWHYPFENEDMFKNNYPSDFISEAIDQTRGWFYTLLAVSTILGKKPPYKNVLCYNHVLDDKGKKMSKSLGNIVSPSDVIDAHGVDATRWYFYTVNNPGDPKLFSLSDVANIQRGFLGTLMNCLKFFELYEEGATPHVESKPNPQEPLDDWILSRLHRLIGSTTNNLDEYNPTLASRELEYFVVEDLSNWWIRRSRDRFSAKDGDKPVEFLRFILVQVSKLLAPFVPFTADYLYKQVSNRKESVHLEDWPILKRNSAGQSRIDDEMEENMKKVREVVTMALAQRKRENIKVRQPLLSLSVKEKISPDLERYIKDEVNVKKVLFSPSQNDLVVLNTELTPDLIMEGHAREISRAIQEMRKEAGCKMKDSVCAIWHSDSKKVKNIFEIWGKKISDDTLLKKLEPRGSETKFDVIREFDLGPGLKLWLGIKKD